MDADPRPRPARSGMIDAWRAFACLAVVLYHGSQTIIAGEAHRSITAFASIGHHGWLGVPVFFVISGYCLAQVIESRARRQISPVTFWFDRLLRIFPVYWAALLLTIALALLATPFNRLPPSTALPTSLHVWITNLSLTTSWQGLYPQLPVSWSLDYEIGFYALVGFALLRPFGSVGRRMAFFAALTAFSHLSLITAYFPLLTLWPQFACGLAIHTALSQGHPASHRLLAGLYPLLLGLWWFHTGGVVAAFAPLIALLLLLTLHFESKLPRPPRLITSIGIVSYSIYLVHLPFMKPFLNLTRRLFFPQDIAFAFAWFLQLTLGVGAGLLFHHFVELRCEALRARLTHR